MANEVQPFTGRFVKFDWSEPETFEHLTKILKRRDEVAHRFADVRLQVAASYHALFCMEIDQDQRPLGERRNARYDGTLELTFPRKSGHRVTRISPLPAVG